MPISFNLSPTTYLSLIDFCKLSPANTNVDGTSGRGGRNLHREKVQTKQMAAEIAVMLPSIMSIIGRMSEQDILKPCETKHFCKEGAMYTALRCRK